MSSINNEIINEIRSKTNIVNVVSGYITLTKKGKNYFGVCPFHDDHSPSMSVSEEKQMYTCFSCGASGNVFTFVSDYEHISFIEAVRLLGSKVGYNIEGSSTKNVKTVDYNIYDLACKFYQNNLNTSLGKNALNYLDKRMIDKETINKFKIGLSIPKISLTDYLINKEYDLNKLINLGITNNNTSDLFINRIMFPLFDLSGNVVGFSGRIYNTKDSSKYVNTKETSIFKKGNTLYNYHNAKEHLRKNDSIIVMEGFMDVIRASTVGIDNCVATMGTALTKNQAILLKKMANNIILCFDGDKAGEDATTSAINVLEGVNIIPKVIRLEDNLDPDEYILAKGKESFIAKINNPLNTIDFKMNMYKEDKNFKDLTDVSKYIDESLKELSKVEDNILVELTLRKIEKEFNIDYEILKNKYNQGKIKKEVPLVVPSIQKTTKQNKYEKAQRSLLFYMIRSGDVIEYVANKIVYFPNDKLRHLNNEILSFYEKYGILNIADFITYLVDNEESLQVFKEINSMVMKEEYTMEEINDYIYLLSEYPKESRISILEKELKQEPDPLKKADILSKIMEIKGVKSC